MKTLSAIRDIVRQRLKDEFVSGLALEWEDDELDLLVFDCISEMSKCSPYEVKETLTTTAGSRDLDISSITNLLSVEEIEYKVGSTPKNMRSCSVFGDILTMDIDTSPGDSEDVYLYCHKLHQLTDSSSTLKPQLEDTLVLGVCAKAAISKARTLINKINIGGAKTPTEMQAWGTAQLVLYRQELRLITKPRMWKQYPKS